MKSGAMNVAVAFAIVLGAAALTAGLLLVIYRWATAPLLADPARGGSMITMVGTAFAVLLAFLTVAAFQTYNGANRGAASEAVAVVEMSRTASFFHAEEADDLRSELVCYGRAVASDEWVTMRDGERSGLVEQWVIAIEDTLSRFDLRSAREQVAFSELLTESASATTGRRERLTQSDPSVPAPLWVVLILGGCVTILFQLAMVDPRERKLVQGGMIVGVTVVVTAGLLLVNFLDHPYGDRAASIQPDEMRATLAMIDEEHPVSTPPCAEDGTPRPGALL
jgi:hypothetical protein